jgi:hypothetical protein
MNKVIVLFHLGLEVVSVYLMKRDNKSINYFELRFELTHSDYHFICDLLNEILEVANEGTAVNCNIIKRVLKNNKLKKQN